MPAGRSPSRRAASSRSAPDPPAPCRASSRCTRISATSTITTRLRSVIEGDKAPPAVRRPHRSRRPAACSRPISPFSTRRRAASPAPCRSPRACSRSRCTRRTSCTSRSSTSRTASARRRSRRPSRTSSGPWAAPTTPSSTAAACSSSCAAPTRPRKKLAQQLPSSTCSAYGLPFAEIFAAAGGDFYKIDPMLFSPAEVIVSNLDTGSSFHAGELAPDVVDKSFR